MRPCEVVLVFVTLVSLVVLGRKPASGGVWAAVAAVAAVALGIHGAVEGFRYQLLFAYVYVVLIAAYACVRSATPRGARRRALKRTAIGGALVGLALTAVLAAALPVFALPKPTGSFAVGTTYMQLIDEHRNDPFLDTAPIKRALMVKVYYPATEDASKPFAPYFHNDPQLIRAFTAFYRGLPPWLFDHLRLVQTHSKAELEVADRQPSYPVVLFSHGAGTSMEVHVA